MGGLGGSASTGKGTFTWGRFPRGCEGSVTGATYLTKGHEATDTGLAYAPVSQAHGHHHIVQCFSLLHCSADQTCTTPGGC